MKRISLLLALVLLLSTCVAVYAQPQTFYVLHELEGTLSETGQDIGFELGGRSCAYSINNDGVVVGSAERYGWNTQTSQQNTYTSEMAVLWTTPHYSQPLNGVQTSRAVDINDDGLVVSQFMTSSWYEGFDGTYGGDVYINGSRKVATDPTGAFATPTAINRFGQVVANGLHGDNEDVSYLLTQGDPIWDYQTLPAEETYGINDLGQAVGTTWVGVWNEDTNVYMSLHGYVGSTDLGHLWNPGVVQPGQEVQRAITTPSDINNQGIVVGESTTEDGQGHAFVWRNGAMTDLGTLGGVESQANAINELNMVVGQAETAQGEVHAFVYYDQLGMIDLNELAPGAADAGLILETAYDVNDFGSIVGKARDEFGQQKGFLLTPGAFLEGATAVGNFDPDGFDPSQFSLDGLPALAESLGGIIDLDGFQLFGSTATLSIAYDEAMLSALGVSEEDIRLFWYDEENQQWVLAGADSNISLGGSFVLGAPTDQVGDFGVDVEANLVWANIDHASTYGVFAVPEPATMCLAGLGGLALLRRRK